MTDNLYSAVRQTAEKYNMISRGDTVLAAVSGGADSMLLLNFLLSVKDELNLTIAVAHVEHGIRGEESKEDARFVERFCKTREIPFYIKVADVPAEAEKAGAGVEEYARKVRYDFFSQIPCDKIATAHNLSDNAETVLFRFIRGTSLKGMCGIPPVRGKIIRPLIEVSSEDIRSACSEMGIEYRCDSTNEDTEYTRNYIRKIIIPECKKLNPSFETAVARFISDAMDDEASLVSGASFALSLSEKPQGLDCEKLKTFTKSEVKRAAGEYMVKHGIAPDHFHLSEVTRLVFEKGRVQLPGGKCAVSDGCFLSIKEIGETGAARTYNYSGKAVSVNEFLTIRELSEIQIDFYCDCDKINGNVAFRPRAEGDRISPAGRGCTKTLKKLFNEYRIPVEHRRDNIVVTDENGIIGVIGCCCDERVVPDSSTKRIYYVTTLTEDKHV